jgi:cation/acetate symporter
LALYLNISGFALYLCALIFCASSIFPVLILSVWWNRMTKFGFIFGLLSGVLMSSLLIYFTNFGLSLGPLGLTLFHSSALVIGLVFLCSIVGSYVGPKPSGAEQDVLMDIRTPGGEALYDRLLRSAMPRRSSLGD